MSSVLTFHCEQERRSLSCEPSPHCSGVHQHFIPFFWLLLARFFWLKFIVGPPSDKDLVRKRKSKDRRHNGQKGSLSCTNGNFFINFYEIFQLFWNFLKLFHRKNVNLFEICEIFLKNYLFYSIENFWTFGN